MDPGAVPGASTKIFLERLFEAWGGETGSTRVVKTYLLPGMIPPSSGHFTSANDNFEALAIAA